MSLQLFIYLNIFLAGAAIAMAGWYAYVHFTAKKHGNENPKPLTAEIPTLPKATRERLLHNAENQFQLLIDHAADELQYDLKATADALSGRMKSLGNEIINLEMKRYKASLEEMREQTETNIGAASAEVAKHQAELQKAMAIRLKEFETSMAQEMTAEKQRLTQQLDQKLAGAVTAFLVETLGHNVDLGAQTSYITETLAAHKNELLKELQDES